MTTLDSTAAIGREPLDRRVRILSELLASTFAAVPLERFLSGYLDIEISAELPVGSAIVMAEAAVLATIRRGYPLDELLLRVLEVRPDRARTVIRAAEACGISLPRSAWTLARRVPAPAGLRPELAVVCASTHGPSGGLAASLCAAAALHGWWARIRETVGWRFADVEVLISERGEVPDAWQTSLHERPTRIRVMLGREVPTGWIGIGERCPIALLRLVLARLDTMPRDHWTGTPYPRLRAVLAQGLAPIGRELGSEVLAELGGGAGGDDMHASMAEALLHHGLPGSLPVLGLLNRFLDSKRVLSLARTLRSVWVDGDAAADVWAFVEGEPTAARLNAAHGATTAQAYLDRAGAQTRWWQVLCIVPSEPDIAPESWGRQLQAEVTRALDGGLGGTPRRGAGGAASRIIVIVPAFPDAGVNAALRGRFPGVHILFVSTCALGWDVPRELRVPDLAVEADVAASWDEIERALVGGSAA